MSAERAEDIGLPKNKIILSAKVSGVQDLISVYRMLARRSDYAIHLGLTEAGMGLKGLVWSASAMGVLLEEGIGARYERHRLNAIKLTKGLEEIGLELTVKPEYRMWALHTPRVPPGVNDLDVRKKLLDRHGIEIQGGFGQLAGKVFRIGMMGECSTAANVDLLLGALKEALA